MLYDLAIIILSNGMTFVTLMPLSEQSSISFSGSHME